MLKVPGETKQKGKSDRPYNLSLADITETFAKKKLLSMSQAPQKG